MIQITKWLNPKDTTWSPESNSFITTRQWLENERERLQEKTDKEVTIRTNEEGAQAIFRGKIK
tara:strand:+ start:4002 stop:4190 length:189 start_codon:yes stop_codon:yes gene_type:complete